MKALNLGEQLPNLAQVDAVEENNETEENVKELQFAFTVSSTPISKQVNYKLCSQAYINKVGIYRIHYDKLLKEIEDIQQANKTFKANEKYIKRKRCPKGDIANFQEDLSRQGCIYIDAKNKIAILTIELDT